MLNKYKKIFEKNLSKLDNLYLVFSEEQYLIDKFEKEFKEKYISEDIEDFNLTYIRKEEEIFKNIVSKSSTLPLMSEKRFIIIKSGNIFSNDIKDFDIFEKFLKKIPKSTIILILINQDLSKNRKKKIIEDYGTVLKLTPPKYGDLHKWIKFQFKQRGKKINYSGINILEKMFNNNLQQLDSEINKICTYLEEKEFVEVSDIKAVITKDRQLEDKVIFDFLDAISEKKNKKSLYLFHHMIENGKVPEVIFAMIIRRIKLMLIIKDFKLKGLGPKNIAKKIDEHPYPVKKMYKYVDNFTSSKLEEILDKFLEIDINVKTGKDKIISAVQNTIVSL